MAVFDAMCSFTNIWVKGVLTAYQEERPLSSYINAYSQGAHNACHDNANKQCAQSASRLLHTFTALTSFSSPPASPTRTILATCGRTSRKQRLEHCRLYKECECYNRAANCHTSGLTLTLSGSCEKSILFHYKPLQTKASGQSANPTDFIQIHVHVCRLVWNWKSHTSQLTKVGNPGYKYLDDICNQVLRIKKIKNNK